MAEPQGFLLSHEARRAGFGQVLGEKREFGGLAAGGKRLQ